LDGDRSGAFWGFWDLVRGLKAVGRKPRMVVLENVYGTLTSHDGRDMEQIARAVANEGYVFGAVVIDAVHFVPQSRPRLFIVGVDASLALPDSIHWALPCPAWHPDAVIRAYNRLPKSVKAVWRWWSLPMPDVKALTMDDILEKEPRGVDWHPQEQTQKLIDMMSEVNRRKVIEAQRFGVLKVARMSGQGACPRLRSTSTTTSATHSAS
jgi:DNA (cytosine-5)-methyltransferase 1